MTPSLDALRDIHDMPAASWWPPAPGWWLLLLACALGGWWLWRLRHRLLAPLPFALPLPRLGGWRGSAERALWRLRQRLRAGEETQLLAGELSQLLRRIAMARHGRAACASLTGMDWLRWLSARDPQGFDWTRQGQALLAAPYAPPGTGPRPDDLERLIEATVHWTRAPRLAHARAAASRWLTRLARLGGRRRASEPRP